VEGYERRRKKRVYIQWARRAEERAEVGGDGGFCKNDKVRDMKDRARHDLIKSWRKGMQVSISSS
jgi:hypothetical protein